MVAFSSAAFFNSITPSGSPLTKITMSGRRVSCPSTTVNWFTASQSLRSGCSKSTTCTLRAGDRAVGARVFDGDAVDEHPVQRAVAGEQAGRLDPQQLPPRLVDRRRRQPDIEARKRAVQPVFEDGVAI